MWYNYFCGYVWCDGYGVYDYFEGFVGFWYVIGCYCCGYDVFGGGLFGGCGGCGFGDFGDDGMLCGC